MCLINSIFFFNCTATTDIYSLSLHDALPISSIQKSTSRRAGSSSVKVSWVQRVAPRYQRSEEHTSELQSRGHLVCRLLLEKKKAMKKHKRSHDKESQEKTKNKLQ